MRSSKVDWTTEIEAWTALAGAASTEIRDCRTCRFSQVRPGIEHLCGAIRAGIIRNGEAFRWCRENRIWRHGLAVPSADRVAEPTTSCPGHER